MFTLDFTPNARIDFASLIQRYGDIGLGQDIRNAVVQTMMPLRAQARSAGDPLYHLRNMKMIVMGLMESPLYVEYGVHDDARVVVIRSIRLLG